jgi:hypothetical protein
MRAGRQNGRGAASRGWADAADPGGTLAQYLEAMRAAGGLSSNLREVGVPRADPPRWRRMPAAQWTGTFNPRPFDTEAALASTSSVPKHSVKSRIKNQESEPRIKNQN